MNYITLVSEQSRFLRGASHPGEVRDHQGRAVGNLTLLSPEDLADIEQAKRVRGLSGPCVPSDQVQAHLRRMEEIRNQEGMDGPKMLDLPRRMRVGEQDTAP